MWTIRTIRTIDQKKKKKLLQNRFNIKCNFNLQFVTFLEFRKTHGYLRIRQAEV